MSERGLPTTESPTVSFTVVIPTRNRPESTVRAVRSVLDQTHRALTVVVVDDGSTDDTPQRVDEVADSRLRLITQANAGAPAARNRGALQAGTAYVTFLDSDDVVEPTWLERFAWHADRRSSPAKILTCGFRAVTRDGSNTVTLPGPVTCWPGVRGYFGHAGTFAVDTELFRRIGGYAEELPANQHTELAFRLLRLVDPDDIEVVDEALLTYHVDGDDNIRGNDRAVAQGTIWLLREHADLFADHRRPRADFNAVAGVRSVRAGRLRDGRRHLLNSFLAEPWRFRRLAMAVLSCFPRLATRVWPPSR